MVSFDEMPWLQAPGHNVLWLLVSKVAAISAALVA
jgi:hypothetical protein